MSGIGPPPQPDFRVTWSDGELACMPWRPGLIGRYGPSNRLLLRGASSPAVADLTILRDGEDGLEAIVSELTPSSDLTFRHALTGWATSLGYRRVWWRDEVVDLTASIGELGGVAHTCCRICGSEWFDDTHEFWLVSSERGVFPLWCLVCGGFLPQWSVESRLDGGESIRKLGERS